MTEEYHHPAATNTITLALDAAASEAGRAVIPLQGKVPLTPRGVKDASRDPATIAAMFRGVGSPTTGYGIATGAASGIVVVDVDGPEARAEAERLGLTSGYVVKTGRAEGDGWHLYYAIPPGVEVRSCTIAAGLEVKGEGSYVVGPGSLHPTGRRYRVVKAGEPSPAPPWLLEAGSGKERLNTPRPAPGSVALDVAGPPIPDGGRNLELTRIAGKLHDGSRDLEALTRDLEAVNAARCTPPLEGREVERIARSIYGKPPCKPTGPEATPEVLEVLDAVEAEALARFGWSGMADHTDYDVLLALCRIARLHGEMIPAGVRVEAAVREVRAEAALGSVGTVSKSVNRLRRAGIIRRDGGTNTGVKRGAFVILDPRAHGNTNPPGGVLDAESSASVSTGAAPRSAPRLRWSAPGHGGRLGKRRGRIVDVLEAAGEAGLTPAALAAALTGADGKRPRPRDLERRKDPDTGKGRDGPLVMLLEAEVVDCDSGRYRLASRWREALDRRRDEDGEIAAARLQLVRDKEAQEAFREAWALGEVVSKERLAKMRRDRDRIRPEERYPSGIIADLERVPDPDPELLEALREYLNLNPRAVEKGPSWLAGTMWCEDRVEGKPTRAAVEIALAALRESRAA